MKNQLESERFPSNIEVDLGGSDAAQNIRGFRDVTAERETLVQLSHKGKNKTFIDALGNKTQSNIFLVGSDKRTFRNEADVVFGLRLCGPLLYS